MEDRSCTRIMPKLFFSSHETLDRLAACMRMPSEGTPVIDQSPQQQGRPSSGEKTEDEIPVSVSSTGRTEPNVLKDNDSEVVNEDQAHAVKDVLRRSNTEMAY